MVRLPVIPILVKTTLRLISTNFKAGKNKFDLIAEVIPGKRERNNDGFGLECRRLL